MKVMEYMEKYGHEQVVYCHDAAAGLRAVIAIHDTTLGPGLGGIRMYPYPSEEDAILDVLRLSRAMTYKSAAAGLNYGGGKVALIGNPATDKTEVLFRSLGRFVDTLEGRYICTEDVGTTTADMEYIKVETRSVVGLPTSQGGSGDPSPATAIGVVKAMEAAVEEIFGDRSLKGKTVAIQGLGKVGLALAKLLTQASARITATDIDKTRLAAAQKEMGLTPVEPDAIFQAPCDIFSPCALGGSISKKTVPLFKCKIVCGSANNQLLEDDDCEVIHRAGILYIPDYVANAGGVINLSLERDGWDADLAKEKVSAIYENTRKVIAKSKERKVCTSKAADLVAEERIQAVRMAKVLAVPFS